MSSIETRLRWLKEARRAELTRPGAGEQFYQSTDRARSCYRRQSPGKLITLSDMPASR